MDLTIVGCNKKMTQTVVTAIHSFKSLNFLIQIKRKNAKINEITVISINGRTWIKNTLNILFDGANPVISVVFINQSKDSNV